MGALMLLFLPIFALFCGALFVFLGFLLFHIWSVVRNTFWMTALLFAWTSGSHEKSRHEVNIASDHGCPLMTSSPAGIPFMVWKMNDLSV
jgi:hypothetical protein